MTTRAKHLPQSPQDAIAAPAAPTRCLDVTWKRYDGLAGASLPLLQAGSIVGSWLGHLSLTDEPPMLSTASSTSSSLTHPSSEVVRPSQSLLRPLMHQKDSPAISGTRFQSGQSLIYPAPHHHIAATNPYLWDVIDHGQFKNGQSLVSSLPS